MCSKNETTIKKQQTEIRSITDNRSRIQKHLNQTKNEMKSLQKQLSEIIQKHQQLEQKYFESQDNCSSNEVNIKQLEDTLTQKENTIDILKSNLEDNKKFIENNQNHKTNEIKIHNSTQQDHNYVIKQNTKANTICQPVRTIKTLNHENVPTTHNEPNQNNKIHFTKLQQQQKNLTHNKRETQINNQQVELKEQLTQLIKQESVKEMLQTTMINTLTQIFSTATL